MKVLRAVVLTLALAVALTPEFARFAAERQVYRATAMFYTARSTSKSLQEPTRAFDWVTSEALSASRSLPGDPRPWMLAGSAQVAAARPAEAVALFEQALRLGERPEINFELGKAYMMLGSREKASTALLRAGWVNPAVLSSLPPIALDPLTQAITATEASLRGARLAAPPPPLIDSRG